jgi:hypothetical protein
MLIDDEELPFTQDEIYQAARTFLPADKAEALANHLAKLGPEAKRTRASRRAGWRAAGVPDADARLLHFWEYPPQLLNGLAALSDDSAQRVLELQKKMASL